MQQTIADCVRNAISPTLLTVFSLVLTYLMAFLSWHLIEKRFLQSNKKRGPMVKSVQMTEPPLADRSGETEPELAASMPVR